MKTTLLVDTESLAIMDAHFTTKKVYDGHIGLHYYAVTRRGRRELEARCEWENQYVDFE